MIFRRSLQLAATLSAVLILTGGAARADDDDDRSNNCRSLPSQSALKAALITATAAETSGLNNQMWGTIVDRDGIVCAVAFSGNDRGAQWPGSRVISAQKANTANSFSLDSTSSSGGSGQPNGLSLSTANLYSAVQPGGSLFGLQHSNPVEAEEAYAGPSQQIGTAQDPMVGNKIGGVNVFGGGLALYGEARRSWVAWSERGYFLRRPQHRLAVRKLLGLDHLWSRRSLRRPHAPDNIIFDIKDNPNGGTGISAGGFGHPTCLKASGSANCPPVQP
jgi:hypothetical protein